MHIAASGWHRHFVGVHESFPSFCPDAESEGSVAYSRYGWLILDETCMSTHPRRLGGLYFATSIASPTSSPILIVKVRPSFFCDETQALNSPYRINLYRYRLYSRNTVCRSLLYPRCSHLFRAVRLWSRLASHYDPVRLFLCMLSGRYLAAIPRYHIRCNRHVDRNP